MAYELVRGIKLNTTQCDFITLFLHTLRHPNDKNHVRTLVLEPFIPFQVLFVEPPNIRRSGRTTAIVALAYELFQRRVSNPCQFALDYSRIDLTCLFSRFMLARHILTTDSFVVVVDDIVCHVLSILVQITLIEAANDYCIYYLCETQAQVNELSTLIAPSMWRFFIPLKDDRRLLVETTHVDSRRANQCIYIAGALPNPLLSTISGIPHEKRIEKLLFLPLQ